MMMIIVIIMVTMMVVISADDEHDDDGGKNYDNGDERGDDSCDDNADGDNDTLMAAYPREKGNIKKKRKTRMSRRARDKLEKQRNNTTN